MGRAIHKISTVSRLTGFTPEVLRVWESRYRLVSPARGPGGQRLYTDEDLAVLHSVRTLSDAGRSIGEIAALGRRKLLSRAREQLPDPGPPAPRLPALRLAARFPPEPLLRMTVDTLAEDFHAALARIWVYDAGEDALLLRASAGLSKKTSESSRARIDLGRYKYKVGVVARTQRDFISNAISGDAHFDQRWVHRERLASVAVLPLLHEGALQGVMATFFRVAVDREVLEAIRLYAALCAASLAAHPSTLAAHRSTSATHQMPRAVRLEVA